ncbi:hypothetical protein P167DRAFT_606314 [Morchella conica CCBAS932]|uniref:Uncharacterized protein n=1 Tax=Morchella conica CCBAS932 TaxID=1392247 RepID=A0A3N4KQ94_9PEZI|nr:hypothetical protein P167DRAFT_606314 [Morchella conica CCBAS932]
MYETNLYNNNEDGNSASSSECSTLYDPTMLGPGPGFDQNPPPQQPPPPHPWTSEYAASWGVPQDLEPAVWDMGLSDYYAGTVFPYNFINRTRFNGTGSSGRALNTAIGVEVPLEPVERRRRLRDTAETLLPNDDSSKHNNGSRSPTAPDPGVAARLRKEMGGAKTFMWSRVEGENPNPRMYLIFNLAYDIDKKIASIAADVYSIRYGFKALLKAGALFALRDNLQKNLRAIEKAHAELERILDQAVDETDGFVRPSPYAKIPSMIKTRRREVNSEGEYFPRPRAALRVPVVPTVVQR